jgi:hypothetical protein
MIQQALKQFKVDFDIAIRMAEFNCKKYNNGNEAKNALIKSQKIINYIHEFIKNEFAKNGVNISKIHPPIGNTGPEIGLIGFLKSKKQDIIIIPDRYLLDNRKKTISNNETILAINVRSQLSSLKKNIDTLYERTFAEPLNLHLICPKQCLGEVYMIPTHEYDDQAMKKNKVEFKGISKIEDYIRIFQAINNRKSPEGNEYKYERVCLLIVDFREENPKLYSKIEELIKDELVNENTNVNLDDLTIENFASDLLKIYSERFGPNLLE